MKFKLFLLILTTLATVALSQKSIPGQFQIQLAEDPSLFWAISGDKVVLSNQGSWWTIVPYAIGSYILPVDKPGKFVQFNGVGKKLSIANHRETGLNQRWQFSNSGGPYTIHSSQNPKTYVTFSGLDVVSEHEGVVIGTQWNLIKKH